MNSGKYIFAQVVDFLPYRVFETIVRHYNGDFHAQRLNCYNHLLHMVYGQLTACTSLRDICLCLNAHPNRLFHLGFMQSVNESSLSRANDKRDYRIFEELGYAMINIVRPKYQKTQIEGIYLPEYELLALDSTSISVSIKLADWALGKYTRGSVKMHTQIDLRGYLPVFIYVTDGKWHDSNVLDVIEFVCNAIYVMDKAYVDFDALRRIDECGSFFVTRAKSTLKYEIVETNHNIDMSTGLRGDHIIRLTGYKTRRLYPKLLRLEVFHDKDTDEEIEFITNLTDFLEVNAMQIANIYRNRWQIEVFFKWVKQNLTVKCLWGYSENAVKIHLWTAIITYLLVARIKAELNCTYSITEVYTLISVSAMEKMPLRELLAKPNSVPASMKDDYELELFDF